MDTTSDPLNADKPDTGLAAADAGFMARALELARATVGQASPNPQVGCVLVRDGVVLGEGAHLYDRFDHAEIAALKQAGDARGATAYVTLEPCSHHGRTGPCADALVAAGIARCVVATADPNPQVSGRGLARLREAGIAVELGIYADEARKLNDAFAFSITHGRPFVTLKAGLSVDGQLAPPPAQRAEIAPVFLTAPEARAEVQVLRLASDAALTGIGTVLADDPLLTDRTGSPRRRRLMRVVLDAHLRTPLASRLVQSCDGDAWVIGAVGAPPERVQALSEAGVRVTLVRAAGGRLDLAEVLRQLHSERLLSVLLEAGAEVNGAFLREGLVDRAVLYYSERELGAGAVPFARDAPTSFELAGRMLRVSQRMVGGDVCVSGLVHDPWAGIGGA